MTMTYSVFEPPRPNHDNPLHVADRFVFVPHKFSWMAFLFPLIWLPFKRMWVAFFGFLSIMVIIETAAFLIFGNGIASILSFLVSLIFAFEANAIRRWSLRTKGWHDHGLVMGSDSTEAEYRFFSSWIEQQNNAHETPLKNASESRKKAVILPQTTELDVIGMFPKPQGV